MVRRRNGRKATPGSYQKDLRTAMKKYLPRRGLPLQVEDGRVRWTPRLVVVMAILMAWDGARILKDRFENAWDCVAAMYATRRRPGGTYEGFVHALWSASVELLEIVVAALRAGIKQVAGPYWEHWGWVLMGVDGSRVECPMTEANEKAFGCGGKKKTTPQQFITTLFHVLTGLPWGWRRGGARSSERAHLREMLHLLPENVMLLADAGFTGYDLLRTLMREAKSFIVRVGSNVRLLKKLGYAAREFDGVVYLWPQDKQNQEPLILRLVVVHDGRKAIYLLTNVLDKSVLSDRRVGQMYRLRWGIEVMYRSLKETMQHRKMASDSPRNAEMELDWAMVGLWMLGLMALEAQRKSGRAPSCWSVAEALRVVRRAIRKPKARHRKGGVMRQLRDAVKDTYQRHSSKNARHWPHKKKEKPPGAPKTRTASRSEVRKAKELRQCEAAA